MQVPSRPAPTQYAQEMLDEPLRKLKTASSLPPVQPSQGQCWGRVTVATGGATHREGLVRAAWGLRLIRGEHGLKAWGEAVCRGLPGRDQRWRGVHLTWVTGGVHS